MTGVELAAAIDEVIGSWRGLTAVEVADLREVLKVRCNTADERPAGCSAVPGVACTSIGRESRGEPLRHIRWHLCRGRRAGVHLAPTTEAELADVPRQRRVVAVPAPRSRRGRPDYEGYADR